MPELKNTFTGGKMEKDLDERILPSGQYREALNISVATSEDSDVGAAQNILGNIKVTEAIQSRSYNTYLTIGDKVYAGDNYHVAEVIDPQTNMLYRFIHTASPAEKIWMDRIVEYDTQSSLDIPWYEKENAVMVDIFKVEAQIVTKNSSCSTSTNKTYITIGKNLNQIRWGMRVHVDGSSEDDVTVENVNYTTGEITLDKAGVFSVGNEISFLGDRNLSFGNTDNIKKITGINIIDGMIFWTDNFSEPKKVNIERSKDGCDGSKWQQVDGNDDKITPTGVTKIDNFNQHTLLIVNDANPQDYSKDDQFGCTT
mgnify:CR=1 FL=1